MEWLLWLIVPVALAVVALLRHRQELFSLSGKHVMVTGGSSGIGKEVARKAVEKGASVTIVARNKERLEAVETELAALVIRSDQEIKTISLDVSSDYQLVKTALLQAGPVDVLVNSAGITKPGVFTQTHPHTFTDLYKVNVLGSVQPTRALLPGMMERRSGRVVFVSSQAGQFAMYGYSAYSASKFALRGLAEAIQMEVKPYNVLISVSFPPDTDTPQLQEEIPLRSQVANEIAGTSGVFPPSLIAKDIITGVEKGKYLITHGLEGFMLGHLTAGMSPVHHVIHALPQVLLMGVFRLISIFYQIKFDGIVKKSTKL